jgi:hypothetical protein
MLWFNVNNTLITTVGRKWRYETKNSSKYVLDFASFMGLDLCQQWHTVCAGKQQYKGYETKKYL